MFGQGGKNGVFRGTKTGGKTMRSALAVLLFLVSACSTGLPDPDSPEAMLYARECGTCHVAYPPHMLKPAMWEMQMDRMSLLRRQRGLPALSARDQQTILAYLVKHAG